MSAKLVDTQAQNLKDGDTILISQKLHGFLDEKPRDYITLVKISNPRAVGEWPLETNIRLADHEDNYVTYASKTQIFQKVVVDA